MGGGREAGITRRMGGKEGGMRGRVWKNVGEKEKERVERRKKDRGLEGWTRN